MTITRKAMEELIRGLEDSLDGIIGGAVDSLRESGTFGSRPILLLTPEKSWTLNRIMMPPQPGFFFSWRDGSYTRDERTVFFDNVLEKLRSEIVHELVKCFVLIDAASGPLGLDPVAIFGSIAASQVMDS